MFIFIEGEREQISSLFLILLFAYFFIEIFSVIFFIHTPNVYFSWARGAKGADSFLVLDPLSEC